MPVQDPQQSHSQSQRHDPAGAVISRLTLVVVIVTAGLAGWGMYRAWSIPPVLDETQVRAQVDLFLEGRLELLKWPGEPYPSAAMFPGFQAVLASISAITGQDALPMLRLYCFGFSWVYAFVVYRLARQFVQPDLALLRAAQAYLLPIAFPFHFLLYTDMFSLLVILTAFWAATCGRRHLTGALMVASLFVRQTNVIFALFLWAFTFVESQGWQWDIRKFFQHTRQWLLLTLSMVLFAVFVLIHGRVGLDNPSQQPLTLSAGNLAMSLILAGGLFAPVHVGNLRAVWSFLLQHRRVVLGVASVALITAMTYESTHRWNLMEGLLRNRLLELLTDDLAGRLLFAAGITATVLSVIVSPVVRRSCVLIYPYWFLQLVPVLLVEPRYYFSTYVLFLLFRKETSRGVEMALWLWFALLSVLIHAGITASHFML